LKREGPSKVGRKRAFCSDRCRIAAFRSRQRSKGVKTRPKPKKPPVTQTSGIVYLLEMEGHYKIGRTKNVNARVRGIAKGLPFAVKVVHTIPTANMERTEWHWHIRFAAKRTVGEWFNLSEEEVIEFCAA
jgi:hypothetical protein